jgi:hypothetical protein
MMLGYVEAEMKTRDLDVGMVRKEKFASVGGKLAICLRYFGCGIPSGLAASLLRRRFLSYLL